MIAITLTKTYTHAWLSISPAAFLNTVFVPWLRHLFAWYPPLLVISRSPLWIFYKPDRTKDMLEFLVINVCSTTDLHTQIDPLSLHTHIYIYICTYISINICIYMYICTYVRIRITIHMHIHIHTLHMHMHMHTHIRIHINTHTHTHTRTRTHTYTCTYTSLS